MNEEKISLLLAGNDYAFDGIVTSLLSITKHCSKALDVYVFTMDLSNKNPKWKPLNEKHSEVFNDILHKANKDSKLILVDMTKQYLELLDGNVNEKNSYTPFALLRLLSDKAPLPDKVLYLDTDTIAMDDITSLWNQDVDGYHFGAVLDHYGKVFISPKYINSGVVLMNLKEMKKDDALGKCRHLLHVKKMKFHDQTALNKVSFGRIKYLPRKFNDQKKLHKDTVIRHFAKTIIWVPYFHTRNIKPWNIHMMRKYNIHYIDDILDEYMKIKANFAQNQQN